jgi:hypothetical protein
MTTGAPSREEAQQRAVDEVAMTCSELIRIDTSTYGDGNGPGERKAGE